MTPGEHQVGHLQLRAHFAQLVEHAHHVAFLQPALLGVARMQAHDGLGMNWLSHGQSRSLLCVYMGTRDPVLSTSG